MKIVDKVKETEKYKIVSTELVYSPRAERIGKQDAAIRFIGLDDVSREVVLAFEDLENRSEEVQNSLIREAILKQEAKRTQFIGREL